MEGLTRTCVVAFVIALAVSSFPAPAVLGERAVPAPTDSPEPPEVAGPLTLVVGGQDEMKTQNPLPAVASDMWTESVLGQVYGSMVLLDPVTGNASAFVAKGIDVDEDGVFEPTTEYDVWWETALGTPTDVTAYYDFNGVRWHDGSNVTVWDLFFSYHVNAMNPRLNTGLRALYAGGPGTTYEQGQRQLNFSLTAKNWQGEGTMPGDPNLRVAVRFQLNEPFVRFPESTLRPMLLPMHVWSRTGGGRHPDTDPGPGVAPLDFGCAVWLPPSEATMPGMAECGNADPAKWGKGIAAAESVPGSSPYIYSRAESWMLGDGDVIGHGPFHFDTWISGVEARVLRNDDYYTGVDPVTGVVYDARLPTRIHAPFIDGIRFKVYKTTQLGVFALQNGEVDFYHWNVGAEFIPDLIKIPEIALEANAEPGFAYMAYNFRREPWGYLNGDPRQPDLGYVLRQAISHLVDKKSFVQYLLQDYALVGHGVVSPANTYWYNGNIPKPDFNISQAAAILDSQAARDVGIGPDPAGTCSKDTPTGCRGLPGIGNSYFEILTPQADYDPVRASAGAMIADAMRQVGLNVVSKPTAFGEITQRTAVHDFEMYILDWRIGDADTDYLFGYFHSSNAAAGVNFPGFQNETIDQVLEGSRTELDRDARQSLVFQAQLLLADARPYEVLYYRTNVEGYRQDRYVNWTVVAGTIWSYWSLLGIHPPVPPSLHVSLSVPSVVLSGSANSFSAHVWDDQARPLGGADVTLRVTSGSLRTNASSGATVSGTTDTSGTLNAFFDAPSVGTPAEVLLSAWASATGFEGGSRGAVIGVYPPANPFLAVRLELPLGDIVPSGHVLPMNIDVRDQDGVPVPDAYVTIVIFSPRLTASPGAGTAVEVSQVFLIADAFVTATTTVEVRVFASKSGYLGGEGSVPITIVPYEPPPTHYLTFATSPQGLIVNVTGSPLTAPATIPCTEGAEIMIDVPDPQGNESTRYTFVRWSDGGNRSHQIACDGDKTVTASFATAHRIVVGTDPAWLDVVVNGSREAEPFAFWCNEGAVLLLEAPATQVRNGTAYAFASWSNGGAQEHAVACTAPAVVIAGYQEVSFVDQYGWVLGGIGALAVLLALLFAILWRRRKEKDKQPVESSPVSGVGERPPPKT